MDCWLGYLSLKAGVNGVSAGRMLARLDGEPSVTNPESTTLRGRNWLFFRRLLCRRSLELMLLELREELLSVVMETDDFALGKDFVSMVAEDAGFLCSDAE